MISIDTGAVPWATSVGADGAELVGRAADEDCCLACKHADQHLSINQIGLIGFLSPGLPPAGRRGRLGRSGPTPPALRPRRRRLRPAPSRSLRSFWPPRPR